MKIKKLLLPIMMFAMAVMARAENPDTFEITMTPIVTYSVTITTPSGGLEFNAVEPGQTYVTQTTATIQNTGNVSADLKISAQPLDTWQLGSEPGFDTVRLLGMLNSVMAAKDDFDIVRDTITTTSANMDENHFAGNQNGNNVPKNGIRLLSIRLDAPTDTSVDSTQRFRIYIKAYPASTF